MSDEPLYCTWCGAEDWSCGHEDDGLGQRCETCGGLGKECRCFDDTDEVSEP